MRSKLLLLLLLFLKGNIAFQGIYDPKLGWLFKEGYHKSKFSCFLEPFKTLSREAGALAEFMESNVLNGKEQDILPENQGF